MKKLIPISLFVIAALCGCELDWSFGHSPQSYYMPDSVKLLFNVGDTFFYETQDKILFDTLVVTHLYYIVENDGDKKTSDEREHVYCKMVSTKLGLQFHIGFRQVNDCVLGGIEVTNQNSDYWYNSEEDKIVDGCKLLQYEKYEDNTIPTAIYYSRRYGILKYEFADSVCYSISLKN